MARRTVSRKELRAEAEAAESQEKEAAEAPKKKKKKRKAAKRKTKVAQETRMKLYWGVFSQNLKRVAVFEFDQKSEAEKRAEELSKGGKSPHFVQKVKEPIVVE